MQQITQVDGALQNATLLYLLNPVTKRNALFVQNTDPCARVNRTIPQFFPCLWQLILKQLNCNRLCGWCQHNCALKHTNNRHDVIIYLFNNGSNCGHFQVDKLVDRILCSHVISGDLDLLEQVRLENILPKLANWTELLSPQLFVESQFLRAHCSKSFKTLNNDVRVKSLD